MVALEQRFYSEPIQFPAASSMLILLVRRITIKAIPVGKVVDLQAPCVQMLILRILVCSWVRRGLMTKLLAGPHCLISTLCACGGMLYLVFAARWALSWAEVGIIEHDYSLRMGCGIAARAGAARGWHGQLSIDFSHRWLLIHWQVLDMLVNEVVERYHLTEDREEELRLDGSELAHFLDSHNTADLQNGGYNANQEGNSEEDHCENQLCFLLSEVWLPSSYLV